MDTLTEIGAYEVKTHLAEFLRKVKSGEAYRITQRGEPVADLVPVDRTKKMDAMRAAANAAVHGRTPADPSRYQVAD